MVLLRLGEFFQLRAEGGRPGVGGEFAVWFFAGEGDGYGGSDSGVALRVEDVDLQRQGFIADSHQGEVAAEFVAKDSRAFEVDL